jgi:hypothetical protein
MAWHWLGVGSGVKDWKLASKAEALCQAEIDAFSNDALKQLKLLIILSSGGISLKVRSLAPPWYDRESYLLQGTNCELYISGTGLAIMVK